MKTRGGGAVARLAALALAAVLPACGDSGTEPSEPGRTRIANGTFTVLGTEEAILNGYAVDVSASPFVLNAGGTLELTAEWTSPANNIDIILYLGSCLSEQARREECTISNRTTSETNKPERLTIFGVPAGSFSLGFANFGATNESGTFEVFLTR